MNSNAPSNMPERTEVAVIGGGIAGCSVAYHLAKLGITDVVICERRQLTCGTTWHAAGLVTQLRATRNMTELAKYTAELFHSLEAETGQATGFRQNGAIRVATTEARFEELKRGASMGRNFGLPVEVIGQSEIAERWPLIGLEGIVGGLWLPKDGQVNPTDVTLAMAKGAVNRGVRILENTKVLRILVENGCAAGVATEHGVIRAPKVVICGGMWSRDLAAEVGVSLPLHAAEHFYIVTEPIGGLLPNAPVLLIADEETYYKEEAGKLLVGCFEKQAKPWGESGIPEEFCFDSLPEDFDHFAPILERAVARVPALATAGIQLFFNGPESFTPDDRYLLGETAEIPSLFCACGFNSVGILSSGGVGKALSEWIRDGHPPVDLADVDVRRMMPFQSNRAYLRARTVETLGLLLDMHWPNRQYATARGVRRSVLHDSLLAAGAWMTEAAGYERPGFFGPAGGVPEVIYSYGRASWFEAVDAECRNTCDAVTLFDQSCFAKIAIDGRDACPALNRISTNDVDVSPGTVVYTQWLNPRGGIEADVTVTRVSETSFLIITTAATRTRDLAWLRRHLDPEAHVVVRDVTSGYAMLSLMGPNTRALLARVSPDDFSNNAFAFGTSREIEIGFGFARATRLTFVGELGWELLIPSDFAQDIFDRILTSSEGLRLAHGGFFAINSMRMEKGYRHWGHDIGEEDSPDEAGLKFAAKLEKPGGFIGRDALMRRIEAGHPRRRLVQIRLLGDSERFLHHDEPIWSRNRIVGSVTSGAWGHRLGASLGMGYVTFDEPVTNELLAAHDFEIEIAWERHPAHLQLRPWYDPENTRVRG